MIVDMRRGRADTGRVERPGQESERERERRQRTIQRLERAVESVTRTRKLVDERLRAAEAQRSR